MREDLTRLADSELEHSLKTLLRDERANVVSVLRHLAEFDLRRLAVKTGFPSLFDYCVRELRMVEGEAARRIHAARACARFPVLYRALERACSRTTVSILAPHQVGQPPEAHSRDLRPRTRVRRWWHPCLHDRNRVGRSAASARPAGAEPAGRVREALAAQLDGSILNGAPAQGATLYARSERGAGLPRGEAVGVPSPRASGCDLAAMEAVRVHGSGGGAAARPRALRSTMSASGPWRAKTTCPTSAPVPGAQPSGRRAFGDAHIDAAIEIGAGGPNGLEWTCIVSA